MREQTINQQHTVEIVDDEDSDIRDAETPETRHMFQYMKECGMNKRARRHAWYLYLVAMADEPDPDVRQTAHELLEREAEHEREYREHEYQEHNHENISIA